MALTPLEMLRVGKVMNAFVQKNRPPESLRDELDVLWTLRDQSVYLLEIRRQMEPPAHERPFAKATWVRTQKLWKIYWQRADLKWHSYEPQSSVRSIQAFCDVVQADSYGCFWG